VYCRACILTMSASNADVGIYLRYQEISLIRNHIDSLGRTCFRTCSAGSFFCFDDTIVLYEIYLADLCKLFCFKFKRMKRISGAYLGAFCAVVSAEAPVIIHYRLHHSCYAILKKRWYKYIVGTSRYTECACGAILVEILY